MDDGWTDKKAKGTKKYVIKLRLTFNGYKDYLLNNEIIKNHNKDLRPKIMMYILKKSIRLC